MKELWALVENKQHLSTKELAYIREKYEKIDGISQKEKIYFLSTCCKIFVSAYETEVIAAKLLLLAIEDAMRFIAIYVHSFSQSKQPPKCPAYMLTAWVRLSETLSREDQIKYYKQAQAFGCAHASYYLIKMEGCINDEEDERISRLISIGSEDPRAVTEVGLTYYGLYHQCFIQKDIRERYFQQATEWLGIAVAQYDEPNACYWFGVIRYHQRLTNQGARSIQKKVMQDAGKYWKMAADRGHADSMFLYGYVMAISSGKISDKVLSIIKQSAKQGSNHAKLWLDSQSLSCPEEFAMQYLGSPKFKALSHMSPSTAHGPNT